MKHTLTHLSSSTPLQSSYARITIVHPFYLVTLARTANNGQAHHIHSRCSPRPPGRFRPACQARRRHIRLLP
ncbi:hypothetical protein BC938DRAFT_473181 [Jimgerdemannia flammicorona]|uniref:Uncharacterized protein n=1 Tax=Jimgerdemannia flammicorona TaxID=994334 RepID=A0A433Q4L8_9FUNG|nr:hypothetical protein BC938DRAFT_473181 [Jimgerdemannia flammicorona]